MYRQENFANGRGAKTPLDKANRQSTDWEKTRILNMSDEGFVFRIHKAFLQFNRQLT